MSRIAFCECGWASSGTASEVAPVDGWWMNPAVVPTLSPGFTGDVDHPVGFTVENLRKMYWNIKGLRLDYNLLFTQFGGAYTIPIVGSLSLPESHIAGAALSDEQELVTSLGAVEYIGSDPAGPYSLTFDIRMDIITFDVSGALPVWPQWALLVDIPAGGGFPENTLSLFTGFDPSGITLTSTSAPFLAQPMFQTGGAIPGSWSGTISLETTGYWAYDGVFDPTTGSGPLIIPVPQGL